MFALPETLDEIGSQITELSAHLAAGTARYLFLLAEFDRREGWGEWGIRSCAHWLMWRCGLSAATAHEHVRVARALEHLPAISASFARGEISYSKVRAVTRIATAESEDTLLMWARHGTASQLERISRGVLASEAAEEPARKHRRRSLICFHDDEGFLIVRGRLAPEDGAVLLKALEEAGEMLERDEREARAPLPDSSAEEFSAEPADDPDEDPFDFESAPRHERRRADALALVAERFLDRSAGGNRPADTERALIVLHTGPGALEESRRHLSGGPTVSFETARRLACDARLVQVTDGADGLPLSVGRRTRVVSRRIRRALIKRDGGCRFPGCHARKHLDAHHVIHWADGGETALDNLILLCRLHHRLIHEDGYSVSSTPMSRFTFFRPDGRPIEAAPTRVRANGSGLILEHRRTGIRIDDATIATLSYTPPDYGMAVEGALAMRNAIGAPRQAPHR